MILKKHPKKHMLEWLEYEYESNFFLGGNFHNVGFTRSCNSFVACSYYGFLRSMSSDYRKVTCPFCLEESNRWFSVHRPPEVIVMEHSDIDGDGDDLCLLA